MFEQRSIIEIEILADEVTNIFDPNIYTSIPQSLPTNREGALKYFKWQSLQKLFYSRGSLPGYYDRLQDETKFNAIEEFIHKRTLSLLRTAIVMSEVRSASTISEKDILKTIESGFAT